MELMKKQIVVAEQKDFADDIFIALNDNVSEENVNLQELKNTEEKY